jgi:histidine triad (HIT) family protein
MKDCAFCKIIRGELAADKIYENEDILAFLDIAPINKAHILIIPKEHHPSISSVPEKIQMQILNTAGNLGKAIVRSCDYDGYNLHLSQGQCAGQAVQHAHMHLIPRIGTDGFHWNWRSLKYEEGEKSEFIEKILKKFNKDES